MVFHLLHQVFKLLKIVLLTLLAALVIVRVRNGKRFFFTVTFFLKLVVLHHRRAVRVLLAQTGHLSSCSFRFIGLTLAKTDTHVIERVVLACTACTIKDSPRFIHSQLLFKCTFHGMVHACKTFIEASVMSLCSRVMLVTLSLQRRQSLLQRRCCS